MFPQQEPVQRLYVFSDLLSCMYVCVRAMLYLKIYFQVAFFVPHPLSLPWMQTGGTVLCRPGLFMVASKLPNSSLMQ